MTARFCVVNGSRLFCVLGDTIVWVAWVTGEARTAEKADEAEAGEREGLSEAVGEAVGETWGALAALENGNALGAGWSALELRVPTFEPRVADVALNRAGVKKYEG